VIFPAACRSFAPLILAAVIVQLVTLQAVAADYTDAVVMMNGDRFVGEIKRLEFGQLEFKSSYMASSVYLDWTKVKQLDSNRNFRVEFDDGGLRFGSIQKLDSPTPGDDFEVVDTTSTTKRDFLHVVSLEPLERTIWGRLRGSSDLGLTVHQHGQTQFSANASVEYPSERFRIISQASSIFSSQEGSADTERDSFGAAYYQFLSKNSFLLGATQLLKDSQMNLDLRSTYYGAAGHFLTRSNRTGFAMFAGFASSHEKYSDATSSSSGNNAEALVGMEFFAYRFASSQFKAKLLVYEGLNQWGRTRIDWDSSLSWEIWKDVYWRLSLVENFDSRPPAGSPRNDYAVTSSFGISF
jgi:hypothetical protein